MRKVSLTVISRIDIAQHSRTYQITCPTLTTMAYQLRFMYSGGEKHLANPVYYFVTSRHRINSGRFRREEDEFSSWLHEGHACLKERKVAESLYDEISIQPTAELA